MRELIDEDQQLRVVFKEFPILGEASVVAARAALAAREQDRYLPFHLALMGSRDLSLAGIMKLAEQVGLDTERLASDMQAPAIDRQLQANHELAQKLGIEGTPAFVIGEEVVPGALDKQRLAGLVEEVAQQLRDLLTAAPAQPGGRLRAIVRPSPIGTSARLIRGSACSLALSARKRLGLPVAVGRIGDQPAPQHVVEQDQAARPHER